MTYVLHIGDKPYSSWSLRGWLLLAAFGLPFEERLWRMYSPEFDAFRAAAAPAQTVPALEWREGGEVVRLWDSLAIAETLAERHPEAGHWPGAAAPRGAARSLAAEMHSGFAALRDFAPMDVRRRRGREGVPEAVRDDLDRLRFLWGWTRERWGGEGPYLFGWAFSAADAFFVPVAFRIRGHRLPVGADALSYVDALLAHPATRDWEAAAEADPRRIARYEEA